MIIKEMFSKDIDRDIKGVVKVEQDDISIIKNELEEYVVTKELQKHFKDFFSAYKKGINNGTDKVGVWISGFFGSGKSHFLKMLSYLLANEDIDGKKPIDFFLEDEKIKDPLTLADLNLALSTPTDVISFNIDSRSETSGTKDKDSILNVFLKMFNEKLGYSTNPYVADLERQLDEEGLYEKFKEKYEKTTGDNWVESRHKFNFRKDRVVKALADIDFMTLDTANDWARSTVVPYEISISGFVEMVKEYLDKKENKHQLVFLVDEMGQYIGDNSDLMLNLQTITENLGTMCQGRAWVVVTSQQDIDSITEVMGRDFSKIQGRFDTRISLTSANVDEVIKLRILDKTPVAKDTLRVLYESKETVIKNLIIFNDTAEKKLYEDKEDFSKVYPFIPYQFDILSNVLTSVREHSSSGKHLSEGERSMLALFKESAEKFMEYKSGTIIPFNIFYDALNKFLDHSHSVVISKALNNKIINPNNEEYNFNVNVLKTLFLVKYIMEVEANVDNITTLMVSHIDEDRRLLKEKVEEALNILVGQMLVQKNGEIYIFLTNEEQEINRLIENQEIEMPNLVGKIGEIIFGDIYPEEKVRAGNYKKRYIFEFNREIDGRPFKSNQSHDFGVKIITPNSEFNGQDSNLRMQSSTTPDVYVDLPNDAEFIHEIRTAMKIEKFLGSSLSNNIPKAEDLKAMKRKDRDDHNNRAKIFLQDSLKTAKFYVNGDVLDLNSKDFKYNLTESLERVVDTVYHKLNYITHPKEEVDIHNLFRKTVTAQIDLKEDTIENDNAIREVLDFIKIKTKNHTKISLREIKNRFLKAPYGFLDADIEWIIAKSFVDGQLALSLNGSPVSLINEVPERIIDYITKKMYLDKLLIEEKEIIPQNMKRSLKKIAKEVFKTTIITEDTDTMVMEFNNSVQRHIEELTDLSKQYKNLKYPGESIVKEGLNLLNKTIHMNKTMDIFKLIRINEDEYLDFKDDYLPVKSFFEGSQKSIWEKTLYYLDVFEASKSYVVNEEIEKIANRMVEITRMFSPFNNISELPTLNDKFLNIYNQILDTELTPVLIEIEQAKNRVMEVLEKSQLEDILSNKFSKAFLDLKNKAESCDNVAQVNGFRLEADKLKIRFLNEIRIEQDKTTKAEDTNNKGGDTTAIPTKKHRNISIKDINTSNSWQIETKTDIEKYLHDLKTRLEKEIEENTILNIEF